LSATSPDTAYTDGTYQEQYANWALLDSNKNIMQQGTWEKVYGSYSKDITITIPNNPSNYVLIGTIYQYDMKYQNNAWVTTSESVIAKDALNIQTGMPIPVANTGNLNFGNILQNIWNWITNFFSNLFG
jgi:hypothetical protein